jgi:hypothetical protein
LTGTKNVDGVGGAGYLNGMDEELMAIIPDAVPEAAIDYYEILRRGGANCGDEDFALCKCPRCARVYLIEYEVDTLYLDPVDLRLRTAINIGVSEFRCQTCGQDFPSGTPWIGPKAPELMQVTWEDLAGSPWRWITARTRQASG